MADEKKQSKEESRRNFLKWGALAAGASVMGVGLKEALANDEDAGETVKVLSTNGKLMEVKGSKVKSCCKNTSPSVHGCESTGTSNEESRKGIAGRRFVMAIDLAKCEGCGECTAACQKSHHIPSPREWMKVFKMQDDEISAPYWMPKPCFHCDNPPCTKVCPVGATFKREDGIVLIDNTRCIGCRFCMAACPYSSRFFNWFPPENPPEIAGIEYSPEQGYPRRVGTVEKCDFCPHMIRAGKMPCCVNACAKDALYFGDENEDAVTSASGETFLLSKLLKDRAGYRFMEDLGTQPRVYYLPPKNRRFPEPSEEEVSRKVKPMENEK